MTEQNPTGPTGPSLQPRFLPLLLILFVGSGCSALVYEIVWLQLLQLVIGSSAVSLAVLLGTFMGGMCLGSIALPRIVSRRRHPLRVYALLELGTGIAGIAVLFAMPYVDQLYVPTSPRSAGDPPAWSGLGGVPAAAYLAHGCNPAGDCAMDRGHAAGRFVVGILLRGNIAGAVFGCLLAGFYLLRVARHGDRNLCRRGDQRGRVADRPWAGEPHAFHAPAKEARQVPRRAARLLGRYIFTIGLSGLCALSAEVIWTRLLSLMLGARSTRSPSFWPCS